MTSDVPREPERETDVLVIGAGIAGVVAAAELTRAGARVIVLDKGRSVGGRLASRRIGGATFDHGAQFITARTPWFTGVIEQCLGAGVVKEWSRGGALPDRHARWRGDPTITAVAKYLARDLEVLLERQVVALRRSEARWSAVTQFGEILSARAVVLTQPCLVVSHDPPLVIAGDGFGGPRVEGAARSGRAAAEAILTSSS